MKWSRQELVWIALLLIIGLGFLLRVYELGDWLHFELDQARDARVIDSALQGSVADLPLLGPKAGGTFLRLAPGFYWLEYLGALLFGGAVVGGAAMVALVSTFSIPLFFLIARRLFVIPLALGLTGIFAVSAFLVLYGRFAWNPNFIPFFTLLGFYALLRVTDEETPHRGRWLLLASGALGLATHMHFLAFLALPTIALLFIVIKRPRIALRFWAGALVLIVLLYLPMALNEWATGGLNTQEFLAALTEKSTKEDHPLIEKAVRNISEFGLHSVVILTGFEGATFPAVIINTGVLGTVCESKCDEGKWYGVVAIVLLGLALVSAAWLWWRETIHTKKDLLLLMLLWFGVTFVLFLPLAYGIAPRFFLLNAPLFLLLLGCLLTGLTSTFLPGRLTRVLAVAIVLALVGSNLTFLAHRFDELSRAGTESVESAPDRILKERIRVTLEQTERIADFLAERSRATGYPVYRTSEPQYQRALAYLLEKRGIAQDGISNTDIYRQGVYFSIIRTQSDLSVSLKKYELNYQVGPVTPFGTLTVIELWPRPEKVTQERQDLGIAEPSTPSQAPPRYTLREFFSLDTPQASDEEGIGDQETD